MADASTKKDRASSIRWQQATIAQMGHTINTLMSLAVGSLGFVLQKASGSGLACSARTILTISALLFGMSILLSLANNINRLNSFRATQCVARNREDRDNSRGEGENQMSSSENDRLQLEINSNREAYRRRDGRTWYLLWGQAATFALGIIAAGIAVLFLYA